MTYRERMTVPASWWVLGALFALSVLAAVGFYVGPWWAATATAIALLATGAIFWSLGLVIVVTPHELRVGRARLELEYLARWVVLDAEQTRRRSGPEADARAYLMLRPYVPTAVELTLDDADDPVPYWLVSSRRPDELAAALDVALDRGSAERRGPK